MDDLDSDWQRKGATLSHKTARKELYGNPFLWLLRREVEALVKKKHEEDYLREQEAKTELARINRDLKRLRTRSPPWKKRELPLIVHIEQEHQLRQLAHRATLEIRELV